VKPTEEQQAILDATGRVLLINARAGTGKTTTLRMIASAHPDRKILYLVFNRKAREEAAGRFPRNVEVRASSSPRSTGPRARNTTGSISTPTSRHRSRDRRPS
jgi:superfamily I DNA/RNA helicase